jgi:hypothetical protein
MEHPQDVPQGWVEGLPGYWRQGIPTSFGTNPAPVTPAVSAPDVRWDMRRLGADVRWVHGGLVGRGSEWPTVKVCMCVKAAFTAAPFIRWCAITGASCVCYPEYVTRVQGGFHRRCAAHTNSWR